MSSSSGVDATYILSGSQRLRATHFASLVLTCTLAGALALGSLVGDAVAQDWGPRKSKPPTSDSKAPSRSKASRQTRKRSSVPRAEKGSGAQSEAAEAGALRKFVTDPSDEGAWLSVLRIAAKSGGVTELAGQLEQEGPETGARLAALGRLYAAGRQEELALRVYERAEAKGYVAGFMWELRAESAESSGRLEEAAAAIENAARLPQPAASAADAWRRAARLWHAAGSTHRLDAALDQVAHNEGGGHSGSLEAAKFAREIGAPQQAHSRLLPLLGHRDPLISAGAGLEAVALALESGDSAKASEAARATRQAAQRRGGLLAEVDEQLGRVFRSAGALEAWINVLQDEAERDGAAKGGRAVVQRAMQLAALFEEAGQEARALETWQQAVGADPKNPSAQAGLLRCLVRMGAPVEQIDAAFRRLLDLPGQRDPQWVLDHADYLHQNGRGPDAISVVDTLEARHRNQAAVLTQVAERLLRYGASGERVERTLLSLRRLEPREESHVLNLGEVYFARGDAAKAFSTWSELLRLHSDPAEGHGRLASTAALHRLDERALEHFEKALRADPRRSDVRREFATLLLRLGRFEPAIVQWRAILAECGTDRACSAEARQQIVAVWARAGRLRAERERLTAEFAEAPDKAEVGSMLSEIALTQGDLEEAARVLERVLELNPSDLDVVIKLELLCARLNRIARAVELAKRASELDPDDSAYHLGRASEYELTTDAGGDDALAAAERLVKLRPSDAAARARLGETLWQLGRSDEAIVAFRDAVRLDPGGDAGYRLATLLRDCGRPAEAVDVLEALVASADSPQSLLRAGRALLEAVSRAGEFARVDKVLQPRALSAGALQPVARQLYVDLVDRWLARIQGGMRAGGGQPERIEAELALLSARAARPLVEALGAGEFSSTSKALDALAVLRPATAIPALVKLVEGQDAGLRARSMVVLAHIGAPAAVPALFKTAQGSRDSSRRVAIWALGAIGGATAGSAIVSLLSSAESGQDKALAAVALGLTGAQDAADALQPLLRHGDPQVRLAAVLGLGAARSGAGLEALADIAADGRGAERRIAVWAYGRAGGIMAVRLALFALLNSDNTLHDTGVRALLDSAREPSAGDPMRAAWLELAPGKRPEALSSHSLERLVLSPVDVDPDAVARMLAAHHGELVRTFDEILHQWSGAALRDALLALASPANLGLGFGEMRSRALSETLAGLLTPSEGRLLELANSSDAALAAAALRVLGRLMPRHPKLEGYVLTFLAAPDGALRESAAELAGAALAQNCGSVEIVRALEELAVDAADWTVQTAAVKSLGAANCGSRPVARLAVESQYARVRREAAVWLAGAPQPEDLPALERAAADLDDSVALPAIAGLGRMTGNRGAVSALRSLRQAAISSRWQALDAAIRGANGL